MFRDGINGFCMALADSVPGVSGGTIAFIMGFYDRFIGGIHDLAFGDVKEKKTAVAYLARLGVGWVLGMAMAVMLLSALFESHIYIVSALFFGFVLGAVPLIVEEEFGCLQKMPRGFAFTLIGLAVVVGITMANGKTGSAAMDLTQFTVPLAVKGVLSLDFSYIPCLTFFGFGILVGAVTVIKAIKVCLEKFRVQMVYLILGMMIGSLYAIGMGPTTLEIPQAPLDAGNFPLVPAIIGVGLVFGLQKIKEKSANEQKD